MQNTSLKEDYMSNSNLCNKLNMHDSYIIKILKNFN